MRAVQRNSPSLRVLEGRVFLSHLSYFPSFRTDRSELARPFSALAKGDLVALRSSESRGDRVEIRSYSSRRNTRNKIPPL